MTDDIIAQKIAALRHRLRTAAVKFQRKPEEIDILAVSKKHSAEAIKSAFESGLNQFGENYLQEALAKREALAELPLVWHFIGPIQSNKTRAIAENFDWVHSVDREKIARRLSEQRPAALAPLQICLQVNVSGEASKSGVSLAELPALAAAVAELPQLQLRGLMAIPAPDTEPETQRQAFAALRQAQEALVATGLTLDTLSMGMSADLEATVAEGSTLVRIGTDIFGARDA